MPSVWYAETAAQRSGLDGRFPKAEGEIKTDVLIVGGGMTGILCAHELTQRGVACRIVEAGRIGLGVTQNTTAKVTAQHGLTLSRLARTYGMETAREYARANLEALAEYRGLAARYDFDFEEKTAFVYSGSDRKKLEEEARLYEALDLHPVWQDRPPIPLETVGALGMSGQAQCNPLKLIYGLAEGLHIHENSRVTEVDGQTACTEAARITAQSILIATHFPMVNRTGLYFMKLYQHRSYLIALRGAPAVDAMYVDEQENGHTFRDAGELLLLGGGDHKTGAKGGGWAVLRALARKAYPESKEVHAWATQDCMTLDGMPYIGAYGTSWPHAYAATGYNKWGMTGSMVAAKLLAEKITTGKSRYEGLFAPDRRMLHPQLLVNGLSAAGNLLRPGRPRCPHMGCLLQWNAQEHTWDCPCHGSRFNREGQVLDNPALRGLRDG